MRMSFVPISSRHRAKQLVNFAGIEFGTRIWPTDFDAVIEWKDRAWLVFEVKYWDKDVPKGQEIALRRFVNDIHKTGKKAIAAVVEHRVDNPNDDVTLADCEVREVYVSGEREWRPTHRPMNAQELAEQYIEYVERTRN